MKDHAHNVRIGGKTVKTSGEVPVRKKPAPKKPKKK